MAVYGPYSEILSNNNLNVMDGGNNIPNYCNGDSTGVSSLAPFIVTAIVGNPCTLTAAAIAASCPRR